MFIFQGNDFLNYKTIQKNRLARHLQGSGLYARAMVASGQHCFHQIHGLGPERHRCRPLVWDSGGKTRCPRGRGALAARPAIRDPHRTPTA